MSCACHGNGWQFCAPWLKGHLGEFPLPETFLSSFGKLLFILQIKARNQFFQSRLTTQVALALYFFRTLHLAYSRVPPITPITLQVS